jgi:ATPase subunit of ABC transporter with duplicated ATPase domains
LGATGNAESVGRLTARSVMVSLFLVIIFDGGF